MLFHKRDIRNTNPEAVSLIFANQYKTKPFKFLVMLHKCDVLVDRIAHEKKITSKDRTIVDNYNVNSLAIKLRMFVKAF